MNLSRDHGLLSQSIGIPCSCGETIHLPLAAVLQCRPAACGGCGARLTIDRRTNAAALGVLQILVDKVADVQGGDVRAG